LVDKIKADFFILFHQAGRPSKKKYGQFSPGPGLKQYINIEVSLPAMVISRERIILSFLQLKTFTFCPVPKVAFWGIHYCIFHPNSSFSILPVHLVAGGFFRIWGKSL